MSHIAWFRAAPPDAHDPLDETAPIIARLRARHELDVVTEADAHDFVWRDFRAPYEAIVYEPGPSAAHRYMRAYRPHYPGVTAPRGLGVGSWQSGRDDIPRATPNSQLPAPTVRVAEAGCSIGAAVARARTAGAGVELIHGDVVDRLKEADVVVALEWPPPAGPPTAALLGMAAARPVIVFEAEATAGWPAFDPQTWQPRDEAWVHASQRRAPIVVSIDPRDEEHSLMLALVRLAAEPALRASLGQAAHAWWRDHATLDHAVAAWEQVIAEAAAAPRTRGHGADHSERVRAVLKAFGVGVDFIEDSPFNSHASHA